MKSSLAAALVGAATARIGDHDIKFMSYMAEWNKVYNTVEEYAMRLERFIEKEKFILSENAKTENTFTVGHNLFSDWTEEEYNAVLGGIPDERLAQVMDVEPIVGEDCVDNNSYCSNWAATGECNTNPNYMLTYCKKSCGVCSDTCVDNYTDCAGWAGAGDCTNASYTNFMHQYCKKSCGDCGGPSPGPTPPSPSGDGIDWRDKGAVNAVQNQASCGSCWAFSAVTTLESEHFIKTGSLLKFSEQQFVDCAGSYGNYGCNGGFQAGAFNYAASTYLDSENSYPYKGKDQSCRAGSGSTGVKASSNHQVSPTNQAAAMKTALDTQPVSCLVQADRSVFQSYSGGVMNSSSCGTTLDHATALVGYGTKDGVDVWIMRNSWGSWWGDKGYMYIQQQSTGKGICGVQQSIYTVTTN